MAVQDRIVAVFKSLSDAQQALVELDQQGWRHDDLSLITRRNPEQLQSIAPLRQGDRMEKSAGVGAAVGGALGLLAGSALLVIPGVGPVVFAGAMASGITGGIVGGIVGAMSGWGIKEDHLREYEQSVRIGKTLILVSGEPSRLAAAHKLLQASAAETVVIHAETADSGKVDE